MKFKRAPGCSFELTLKNNTDVLFVFFILGGQNNITQPKTKSNSFQKSKIARPFDKNENGFFFFLHKSIVKTEEGYFSVGIFTHSHTFVCIY